MEKIRPLFGYLIYMSAVALVEVQQPPKITILKPSSLVQVSMVYRHGDRNPVAEYPKSEFFNETNWKEGFGELTLTGMKQHYEFGKWIMARYGPGGMGLLPQAYYHKDYKVFSTDVDRTIQSALANSAGIYIPPTAQGIAPDIHWNPVPVRPLMVTEYDTVFAQFCPVVPETLLSLRVERFAKYLQESPELFQYTDQNSGLEILKIPRLIITLYEILRVESTQKGRIPEWGQSIFPNPLQKYYMEFLKEYVNNEKMMRLTAGPTLKTILDLMVNNTLGLSNVKLYSFSAHDTNVFGIMQALGVPVQDPPKYTSAVIFELYREDQNNYFVKVLYRPGPGEEPVGMVIPGCGGSQFCHLETLIDLTRRLMPTDLERECAPSTAEFIDLSKKKQDFRKKYRYPFLVTSSNDKEEKIRGKEFTTLPPRKNRKPEWSNQGRQ